MKIKADTALLQARLDIMRAKAEPARMRHHLDRALAMLDLVWPTVVGRERCRGEDEAAQ